MWGQTRFGGHRYRIRWRDFSDGFIGRRGASRGVGVLPVWWAGVVGRCGGPGLGDKRLLNRTPPPGKKMDGGGVREKSERGSLVFV